jgi:hypothetical protein
VTIELTLANLAIRADVDGAAALLGGLPGCAIVARHEAAGEPFAETRIGETTVNVFGRALYETAEAPLAPGFLHASFWVPSLDEALAEPAWAATRVTAPETIEGDFGRRRIAFFEPLAGVRIELMEDLGAGS